MFKGQLNKEFRKTLGVEFGENIRIFPHTPGETLPGVLGQFIFRDLGRRVIYFQGFGEKA